MLEVIKCKSLGIPQAHHSRLDPEPPSSTPEITGQVRHDASFQQRVKGVVLAVGKFESIHRGHRTLIDEVVRRANSKGLASAVMVFEPHPITVLSDLSYRPLFSESERIHLFNESRLDYLFICPFNDAFAALSPEAFCNMLFHELNVHEVVVGEGYRFGHKREGTVDFMRGEALKHGRIVHVLQTVSDSADGGTHPLVISTSLIRRLLSENRLPEAQQLLGFPFFIMGTDTKNRQHDRTVDFPTLNIYPDDKKFLPSDGAYVSQTYIRGGTAMPSITNICLRPTAFDALQDVRSVETHVLNMPALHDELYAAPIKVELLIRIHG